MAKKKRPTPTPLPPGTPAPRGATEPVPGGTQYDLDPPPLPDWDLPTVAALDGVIAGWLRRLTPRWQCFRQTELTSLDDQAIDLLVTSGLLELGGTVLARMPGQDPVTVRAVVSGDFAVPYVHAICAAHPGWEPDKVELIDDKSDTELRLTTEGQDAKADILAGGHAAGHVFARVRGWTPWPRVPRPDLGPKPSAPLPEFAEAVGWMPPAGQESAAGFPRYGSRAEGRVRIIEEPPAADKQPDDQPATEDFPAFMAAADLASAFHLPPDRVRKRLERWRQHNDGWIENQEAAKGHVRYTYSIQAVTPILLELQRK